jgi:hypothetical protein
MSGKKNHNGCDCLMTNVSHGHGLKARLVTLKADRKSLLDHCPHCGHSYFFYPVEALRIGGGWVCELCMEHVSSMPAMYRILAVWEYMQGFNPPDLIELRGSMPPTGGIPRLGWKAGDLVELVNGDDQVHVAGPVQPADEARDELLAFDGLAAVINNDVAQRRVRF